MTNFMVEVYNNIESDQGKNLFLERIIVSNELKMKLCTKILSGTSISHFDENTKIIENLNDLILTEQLDKLKHNVAILDLYLRLFYYFRTKINENSFLLSLFDLDDQGPKFSESIKNLSTFIRDRILNDSFLSENCDLSQDLYEDLLYIV
ncbi:unnamed protein product [Brachionus calyciflorus]|uniref:Uncharacterized protein n=1 Tax=Brachionus calyciflorus TaxID=104777 RepID=A0A813VYI2_9BILA|nr:unnamed protein product [Brachionus calyciflorus]